MRWVFLVGTFLVGGLLATEQGQVLPASKPGPDISSAQHLHDIKQQIGEQTNLQTGGDIVELVKDVQKTMYNPDGSIAVVNHMKDSFNKVLLGDPVQGTKGVFEATPSEAKPQLDFSSPWMKQAKEDMLVPLQELKDKLSIDYAPTGPTPWGDLSEKMSSMQQSFQQSMSDLSHRYFGDPSKPKVDEQMQQQLKEMTPFVGPGENPLTNPFLRFGNEKGKLSLDQENSKLFPNFPSLEQALRNFDESYTAFGDPKAWARLKAKQKAQGPSLIDSISNYFTPDSVKGKTMFVQSPARVTPDFSTLAKGEAALSRLTAAANDALKGPTPLNIAPPTTPAGMKQISPSDFAMEEARQHVKQAKQFMDEKNVKGLLAGLNSRIDEMKQRNKGQYSIFTDPKYQVFSGPNTNGKLDDLFMKSVPQVLGIKKPQGEAWDRGLDQAMDSGWKAVNGPHTVGVASLAGDFNANMAKLSQDNLRGSPSQSMGINAMAPPPAKRFYSEQAQTKSMADQFAAVGQKMQNSEFLRNVPAPFQDSVVRFGGMLQDPTSNIGGLLRSPMSRSNVNYGLPMDNQAAINKAAEMFNMSPEKATATLHESQDIVKKLMPPELAEKMGLVTNEAQEKSNPSLVDPIGEALIKQAKDMVDTAKEEIPILDAAAKDGLGTAFANYVNEQAQSLSMLPKGALFPTNPSLDWFNAHLKHYDIQPLKGPIPDPNQLAKVAQMFNMVPKLSVGELKSDGQSPHPFSAAVASATQPDKDFMRQVMSITGTEQTVGPLVSALAHNPVGQYATQLKRQMTQQQVEQHSGQQQTASQQQTQNQVVDQQPQQQQQQQQHMDQKQMEQQQTEVIKQIIADVAGQLPSVQQPATDPLAGVKVMLHDFKTSVELNGQIGKVVNGESVQGRHRVQLPSGAVVLVKPDNMQVQTVQTSDAGSADGGDAFMTMGENGAKSVANRREDEFLQ